MKIVLAPDSFKESLSAVLVAEALERGVRRAAPDARVEKIPIADGGEGTVEVLVNATGGEFVEQRVTGPLGASEGDAPVTARYGLLATRSPKTAVIEMAAASGLPLVPPEKRNPLLTTTFGAGELIRSALDHGAREIVIGIGGSATVDGGAGMAQALGVRLIDNDGKELLFGGGALSRLAHIDISRLDSRIGATGIDVACDVQNPLVGPSGAARVYGPQKGATPDMVRILDDNLAHFADVVAGDLGVSIAQMPGAGAAGGLGGGLVAFLRARLRPGFDIVADIVRLDEKLRGADLVITGEGRMDGQAIFGKAPIGVARRAAKSGAPVVAIVGSLGEGWERVLDHGIDACFTITPGPMSLADAIQNAPALVERAAEQVVRLFLAKRV